MLNALPASAGSLLIGLFLGQLLLSPALADDPASQQLREQTRSLQALEHHQRLQRWRRRSPGQTSPAPTPGDSPTQHCWPITGVQLRGNALLSNQQLAETIRPILRPCMGTDAINQLLHAITRRYVQAGYPTSRPYLARHPQAGTALEIVVVEGFVESIELASPDLPLSLRGAFPNLLGQPLHLPDLEQGLDQLNRLRAYELSVDLLPGDLQGGSRVVVQPHRVASRWHLDGRLDNRGSELTGRHRLNLGVGLDSPLGLNDDLRLSLLWAVIDAPGQSQGLSVYYSVPYGPWTFSLNASHLSYRAPLPEGRIVSSGHSVLQGLSIERMLWRNQHGVLSASANLARKQLVNELNGTVIGLQSPTLTTLEAGINLLWLEDGLWNAYVGLAQGLDWFGADHRRQAALAPDPQFRKYRASLLHLRQGPSTWPWRWQSELNLQYSRDVLHAIEQQLLSDDSAVRGFRQSTVAGASGAVWRNTLSQPLGVELSAGVQLRPQLGLDIGWSRLAAHSPAERLVGGAIGIELTHPSGRLRLDYQHALHSSARSRRDLDSGYWVLDMSLSL